VKFIAPEWSNYYFRRKEKNRRILIQNEVELPNKQVHTCLNGLWFKKENTIKYDLKTVTKTSPSEQEIEDLIFASKVCKNNQYYCLAKKRNTYEGHHELMRWVQTVESKSFRIDLKGASIMLSDCVQLAKKQE
jgi:phosphoribosylaminoimidazolecarboxamide formyltransferase/IMP cyclohydrolase